MFCFFVVVTKKKKGGEMVVSNFDWTKHSLLLSCKKEQRGTNWIISPVCALKMEMLQENSYHGDQL